MTDKTEWVSCFFGIIGAFTVASNTAFSGYGYFPFLVGAVGYCYVSFCKKDVPLFLLNLTFAVANTLGIIRWIIL